MSEYGYVGPSKSVGPTPDPIDEAECPEFEDASLFTAPIKGGRMFMDEDGTKIVAEDDDSFIDDLEDYV